MRYYSTRDQNPSDKESVDFEKALFSGYTSDGGLYVPRDLPRLDWQTWRDYSYQQIVSEILKAFIDDDSISLEEIAESVYSQNNFDHPDIVPVVKVTGDGVHIAELFHGPTWSFKDYALQAIGPLLQYYLKRSKKHLILMVVTTGDTGSAAIEAVRNCPNIDIIVLFPKGRITSIQERQMTSVISENVHVFPGEGVSGDLDNAMRRIFGDVGFVEEHNLGSINSINWARIMVQLAHWFYAYFQIMAPLDRIGETLTVAVPTGAAGNLSGALYAKKLGLPILVVACNNENDTVHKWISTGRLQFTPVRDSLASAMDIDLPLNVERIIHLCAYEDASCAEKAGRIAGDIMRKFYEFGEAETPLDLTKKLQSLITSCAVSDKEITTSIKRLWEDAGYICCPHTATAINYAYANPGIRPICCAATASPHKFDAIFTNLGIPLDDNEKVRQLEKAETRICSVLKKGDDWVEILKKKIIEISNKRK